MSRVFVSSTCYDLVDLRAELKLALVDGGLEPVMSDDVDYFNVSGRTDSIETCLANVRTSGSFVCILSQRYGPSLAPAGYADVSATHLEYREAKAHGLPIHLFVRDRLEAEYSLARKHRHAHGTLDGFHTRWVPKGNEGIFAFLEEHAELAKDSSATNWYTLFTTSVDLRARAKQQLSVLFARATIARLRHSDAVPILTCKVVHWKDRPLSGILLRTLGRVPALDVAVGVAMTDDTQGTYIGDLFDATEHPVVLGPNSEVLPTAFSVSFSTPSGYRLAQEFVLEDGRYRRGTLRLRDGKGAEVV